MKQRICVWFSCGVASAVAAKLCLSKYGDTHEIAIVRCVVANEHPDNDRFAADCEAWFDRPIIQLRSKIYKDCWEVWEHKRFIKSPAGAPCTIEMKKRIRQDFEREWMPDVQVYGYTCEEIRRVNLFQKNNPETNIVTPLIDKNLSKSDCLAMVNNARIEIPAMYKLGYNNNNCIGCPKGGMGYWNKIRVDFPDEFDRMARLERKLGYSIFDVYLDEMSPDAGRHAEPEMECSLFCVMAENEMNEVSK